MHLFSWIIFLSVLLFSFGAYAQDAEIKEDPKRDDAVAETGPETADLQKPEPGAEEKEKSENAGKNEKKSDFSWSFYSKNRSHIFLKRRIGTQNFVDNYAVLETKDGVEFRHDHMAYGLRKTLLFFVDKAYDDTAENFYYKYSHEHFNHCWEQYLDRIYVKGAWKNFSFTAGDFYESMNRGMAFSVTNSPKYGDNSIRGASLAGNVDGFYLKAFGGRANPELRDTATFERMNETDDWLAGFEFAYKHRKFEVGVEYGYGNYGSYQLLRPEEEATIRRSVSAEKEFHFTGAYVALKNPFPRFSFYAGAVYVPYGYERTTAVSQFKENDPKEEKEKNDLQNGAAFYSSALYYFDFGEKKSRFTFKIEGKMYNKFFLNYSRMEDSAYRKQRYFNPPTMLPNDLQIDTEFDTWAVGGRISYNENYSGIRFHADLVKGDTLDNKEALPESRPNLILNYQREDFWFTSFSAERDWSNFSLSAGVGYHTVDGNTGMRNSRDWVLSFLHLGGHISDFSLKFNNDYYMKDYWLDDVHKMDHVHELKTVIDFAWKQMIFVSVKNTLWIEKDKKDDSDGKYSPDWYTGGAVGYKDKMFKAYLFGGLEKGGFSCEGGTCRYLPDFKGIKIEFEVTL
ncbi:hypothetical protein IKR20_02330 [bacterium]|nr:hypothetical protein [bacterium]